MKHKREITEHLKRVGYNENDRYKIVGYLVGSGLTRVGESVLFKKDGNKEFKDFVSWVEDDIMSPSHVFALALSSAFSKFDSNEHLDYIELSFN